MNSQENKVFIEKLMAAKQLEKEALMMLLPDKMKSHLDVIGKEVRSMMTEMIQEIFTEQPETTEKATDQQSEKVKKVDIE